MSQPWPTQQPKLDPHTSADFFFESVFSTDFRFKCDSVAAAVDMLHASAPSVGASLFERHCILHRHILPAAPIV
jgi:hypothetical protein